MKTKLTFLPAFLATSVPASMAVELLGLPLPPVLEAPSLFSVLIVTLLAWLAIGDYSRPQPINLDRVLSPTAKAEHPLAA